MSFVHQFFVGGERDLFNRTERLQIEAGRNDRWKDRDPDGQKGSRGTHSLMVVVRQRAIMGGKHISPANRKAAERSYKRTLVSK